MRVFTQAELNRMSRAELMALQQKILQILPDMADGSAEFRTAYANLQATRKAIEIRFTLEFH
ncbi:hypothetical protein [Notoacmeibacter marinus]|uniref:hypothetical protein n=1 Tax=Notoacmeibacter marinus TaxID=1876515 RepID=UPI00117B25E8|nr:hypothetical protein [Notoacmeibacter marinus]